MPTIHIAEQEMNPRFSDPQHLAPTKRSLSIEKLMFCIGIFLVLLSFSSDAFAKDLDCEAISKSQAESILAAEGEDMLSGAYLLCVDDMGRNFVIAEVASEVEAAQLMDSVPNLEQRTAKQLYNDGINLMTQQSFNFAEATFHSLLELYPESPEAKHVPERLSEIDYWRSVKAKADAERLVVDELSPREKLSVPETGGDFVVYLVSGMGSGLGFGLGGAAIGGSVGVVVAAGTFIASSSFLSAVLLSTFYIIMGGAIGAGVGIVVGLVVGVKAASKIVKRRKAERSKGLQGEGVLPISNLSPRLQS